MTTMTSGENLRTYRELKGKAREKAFQNLKGLYLNKQGPDFIQEMKVILATLGINVEEYDFGWDYGHMRLEYGNHKRELSHIKGVRAYSFIENNMLNRCHKRQYRMKVYDRWNHPWTVYHGMNMIVRLQDRKWMDRYEFHALKNVWDKFNVDLRSGKEPSVADFISNLSSEYTQEWVSLSKSYTDADAGWDAMKYKFDKNGDIYVYDKYADIRVDF